MPPKVTKAQLNISSKTERRANPARSKYSKMRQQKWTLTRPMRKAVEAIVHKEAETKIKMFSSNYTSFNAMVNGSGDVLRLLPDISNGTGGDQKLGNRIKLQRLKFRGVLQVGLLAQTTTNNTRFGVRLTICRLKKFDDWNASSTDLATNWTRLLEGSATGMDGSAVAFNTPLNADYVSKVYDKRFFLTMPSYVGGTNVAGDAAVESTRLINFDIPYSRRFLAYDPDSSTTQPVDYPYFMLISYCKLDGTGAVPGTGESLVQLQYTVKAEFEDA